jgi:hypothetical protein
MSEDPYHEGTTKLEMARQAASLSVQELAPRDLVGVIAFDSSLHWIVPVASLSSIGLPTLQQRIGALTADGGTDMYPALLAGFEAVRDTDAPYKHIILLTDGISCCGGAYPALLDKVQAAHVTLSTIAVGGDADQQLLAQLARQGDGRYYFADHARDIPRLMTRETNLATRGPLVEGTIAPRQVAPDALLSGLAPDGLPALSGYLATSPKDLADVLLASDAGDPLLARGPYGLGRAVAWTSDLRGRWSSDWLTWSGLPRLLTSLVSWTIPAEQGPLRVRLRAGPRTAQIAVEEREPRAAPAEVRARVAGPAGQSSEVDLVATAPGLYQGEFPLGGPGTYLVRVEERRDGDLVAAASAGLPVAYAAEYRRVAADPARLGEIAAAGGGHALVSPAAAFADDLPPVSSPLPLTRILLALAAVLLPVELALRRLRTWRDAQPQTIAWTPPPRPAAVNQPAPENVAANPRVAAPVAPAVAREVDPGLGPDEEDALAYTLRWLATRRRGGTSS